MSTAPDSPSDTVLAAEWALGFLDPEEHRAVDARRLREPAFDHLCAVWMERAAELLEGEVIAPPLRRVRCRS